MNSANFDGSSCPIVPPGPTACEAWYDSNYDHYASSVLTTNGNPTTTATLMQRIETGFLRFEEMCTSSTAVTCNGVACDGTCVSGKFWGVYYSGTPSDVKNFDSL